MVNKETGKKVVLSEPLKWGQRLTLFDFELEWATGPLGGGVGGGSQVLNANAVAEDPQITGLWRTSTRRSWRTSTR